MNDDVSAEILMRCSVFMWLMLRCRAEKDENERNKRICARQIDTTKENILPSRIGIEPTVAARFSWPSP